jgi:hypothetical protein
MPALVGHEREAAENRLQALKFELHALPDQSDIPPVTLAIRVQSLVREIQQLQLLLGGSMLWNRKGSCRQRAAYGERWPGEA